MRRLRVCASLAMLGLVFTDPKADMLAEADADANEAVRAELGGLQRTPTADKMWQKLKVENHCQFTAPRLFDPFDTHNLPQTRARRSGKY
jgi:hypothetical protein